MLRKSMSTTNAIDADYSYQNIEMNISGTRNYLEQKFIWLEKLLMYFPMWVPIINNGSNSQRNKCLSFFIISISSMCTVYHGIVVCWWLSDEIDSSGPNVYQLVFFIDEILHSLIRLMTIYYFMKHFNFPLASRIAYFNVSTYINDSAIIQKCNRLFIGTLVIINAADLFIVYSYIQQDLLIDDSSLRIQSVITDVIGRVFVYWPMHLCVCLSCCIFIKYHSHMNELTDIITNTTEEKIQFDPLFEKYRAVKIGFEHDYHRSLKMAVETYLALKLIDIWLLVYEISTSNLILFCMDVIGNLLLCLMYLICASLVTDAFEKFDKLLWTHCENDKKHESNYQNFFLNYTAKYPLVIKIGNFRISRKNSFKFIFVFASTKFIAYALKILVPY